MWYLVWKLEHCEEKLNVSDEFYQILFRLLVFITQEINLQLVDFIYIRRVYLVSLQSSRSLVNRNKKTFKGLNKLCEIDFRLLNSLSNIFALSFSPSDFASMWLNEAKIKWYESSSNILFSYSELQYKQELGAIGSTRFWS